MTFVDDTSAVRAMEFASLDSEGAAGMIPVLLLGLGDDDWRVRREAALALSRAPDHGMIIERLLDRVLADDVEARNAALEALRTLHAVAQPQVLARLTRTVGPRRRFLVEALMEAVTRECLPTLTALLDDEDPNLPPAAIEVISALPDPSAVPVLIAALHHRDPVVRIGALLALQARARHAPVDALVACVRDPLTARLALSLLVVHPDPAAFEAVLQAMERTDRRVFTAAVRACESFGRRGDRRLRAPLVESSPRWSSAVLTLAADPREELAVPAVWMLGHAANQAALAVVLGGLSHHSAALRAACEDALDVAVTHMATAALAHAATLGPAARRAVLRAIAASDAAMGDDVLAALARIVDDPQVGAEALRSLARHAPLARVEGVWRRLLTNMRSAPKGADFGAVARTLLSRTTEAPASLVDAALDASPAGLSVALEWVRAGRAIDASLVDAALLMAESEELTLGLKLVEAIGDARWVAPCEELLERPALRGSALAALRGCAVDELTLIGWLADPRAAHRLAAVLCLSDRGLFPPTLAAELLEDPDPEVALATLQALGDDVPTEHLRALLQGGDAVVVQEALAMLLARGPASLDLVFEALGHVDSGVRSVALSALDVRSQEVRARLYLRLGDERDPTVAMLIERLLESATG